MTRTQHTQSKAVQGVDLDRLHATLALEAPASSVKYVSAKRAASLSARGIETVRQLLETYPRRYLDMSCVVDILHAQIGQQCTIQGTVHEVKKKNPRPRLSILEISLVDQTGLMMITCFNQPWLANSVVPGTVLNVSGKVEFNYGFKRMTNPLIDVQEEAGAARGVVLPLHPASASVSRANMRRIVSEALASVQGAFDPLPLALRLRYRLCSRSAALRAIHEPSSMEEVSMAHRRLLYEELFFLEYALVKQSLAKQKEHEPFAHKIEGAAVQKLQSALPFELTADQEQAKREILEGMAAPSAMNHLVLGDVGTGKTVLAAFALCVAAQSGHQAFMMGPTEVLARQYGSALGPLLDAAGVTWAVLASSTPGEERASLLSAFRTGGLDVLFGTQALLEPDVVPLSASLAVIDEEQRFGVGQKEELASKAPGADVLSLTATPIPRSLALALYGNTQQSYLHAAPAKQGGRATRALHFTEEGIAYDAVRAALAEGRQAYVVCPLIGIKPPDPEKDEEGVAEEQVEYALVEFALENEALPDVGAAAAKHAEVLQGQVFPEARVGLLHGKLSAAEKQRIMESFRNGEIDILVSTTVIEVGVDVPNATVMIIEDADRFGLAQLHQLRGRVGRGAHPGQVFLISRSKAPAALERLAFMETTEDGFELSEYDLANRREGDIFGSRQHGRVPLKLVNVMRDKAVIKAAYEDARSVLEQGTCTEEEVWAIEQELAMRKLKDQEG